MSEEILKSNDTSERERDERYIANGRDPENDLIQYTRMEKYRSVRSLNELQHVRVEILISRVGTLVLSILFGYD